MFNKARAVCHHSTAEYNYCYVFQNSSSLLHLPYLYNKLLMMKRDDEHNLLHTAGGYLAGCDLSSNLLSKGEEATRPRVSKESLQIRSLRTLSFGEGRVRSLANNPALIFSPFEKRCTSLMLHPQCSALPLSYYTSLSECKPDSNRR